MLRLAIIVWSFVGIILPDPVTAQDPSFVLSLTDASTSTSAAFDVDVSFDNTSASSVSGWGFGVCSDAVFVAISSVADGATTATVNGGLPPAFNSPNLFVDGWTIGVVIDFFGLNTLAPGGGYHLHTATYGSQALPGVTTLEYCGTLGTGVPIPVEIALATGPSVVPTQLSGTVTIDEPVDPDYTLSMPLADGLGPGAPVDVAVSLDSSAGSALGGWSFNVCHDPAAVSIDAVSPGATTLTVNGGLPPEFQEIVLYESGYALGVIVSSGMGGNNTLPPGPAHELHVATYTELAIVGSTPLGFCGDLNPFLAPLVVRASDAVPLTPTLVDGGINEGMGVPFIRGDADGNGNFNGLTDAIFTLNFQFTPGSDAPPCMESVDANDDGNFNGLVDGLFILQCQFIPMSPCPAAPYPLCGLDPAPMSSLGCASHPGCAP